MILGISKNPYSGISKIQGQEREAGSPAENMRDAEA